MRRRTLFLAATLALVLPLVPAPLDAAGTAAMSGPAHAFGFAGLDGGEIRLADFAGKVVLVVNTASECAYAPQFADLQALHERYASRGLVVIGVPSNDFGGQEPGNAEAIKAVCSGEYGVTFAMADKAPVRGPAAHPFYRHAADALGPQSAPRWNFHKYLVTPEGAVTAAFPSAMSPRDPRIIAAIEANLPR